jgi:hypothetical protein
MYISAGVAALGGVIAWVTIRTTRSIRPTMTAGVLQPCHDPCRAEPLADAS